MRILYLPIFEPGSYHERSLANKRGLREAFERIGEVYELDYLAVQQDALYRTILNICEDFKPTLIFTQIQGSGQFTPEDLRHIRMFSGAPIVNWNGDFSPQSMLSPEMINLECRVDLQLVVNGSVIPKLRAHGIHAELWPHSFEPAFDPLPDVPAHDVVFLGNNYSEKRGELYKVLRSLPCDVGIYGNGWPQHEGECTYDFTYGEALYRKAKICISDNEYDGVAYLSNRPFQAMAAGCFVLQQRVPELTRFTRLVSSINYWMFDDLAQIPGDVEYFLRNTEYRAEMALAGQRLVQEHHSFDARVKQLLMWLDDNKPRNR